MSFSRLPILLVLPFILASGTVSASVVEPSCAELGEWEPRGITRDAVLVDGEAWLADGRGLAVFDIDFPEIPRLLFRDRTETSSIAIAKGGAFVTLLDRGHLTLYDPVDHSRLTRVEVSSGSTLLAAEGNLVAIAGQDEITTFRVAGAEVQELASIDPSSPTTGMTLLGGRLFLANGRGVESYDVETLARIDREPASAVRLISGSGNLIVGTRENVGFVVISVQGDEVTVIGSERPPHPVEAATISGEFLVVSDGVSASTLYRLDRSGSVSRLRSMEEGGHLLASDQDTVLMSRFSRDEWGISKGTDQQLTLYEIEGDRLVRRGEGGELQRPVTGVAVDRPFAFVSAPPSFSVVDLSASRPETVARLELDRLTPFVRLAGDMAILYGGRWVQLIDVSKPERPVVLGEWETLGLPGGSADLAGGFLVEANHASGFHVVDISDPGNAAQVGGLINRSLGQWRRVAGMEGVVYALTNRGFAVIDIRNPSNPFVSTFTFLDGPVEIRAFESRNLVAVLDLDELFLYDVSSRYAPELLSSIAVRDGFDLELDGDSIWVLSRQGEVREIDIADTRSPRFSSTLSGFDNPSQVGVDGGVIAVADETSLDLAFDPTPVPRTAVVPQPPELVERVPELARIRVAGTSGGLLEAEITTEGETRVERLDGNSLTITESEDFEVRVRETLGCQTTPWSNPLLVKAFPEVFFVSRRSRTVVGSGAASEIRLPIRNEADEAVDVSIGSTTSSIVAGVNVTLAPSSTTIVSLPVTAAEILGSIDATVTLDWNGGSDSHQVELSRVVAGKASRFANEEDIVLPGIGSTAGARNTEWRSDLFLHCGGSTGCTTDLQYHADGEVLGTTLTLLPGELIRLEDVARNIFAKEGSVGYAVVKSNDDVEARAWTYNTSETGRFGQQIEAASPMTESLITGIEASDRYRTNIGLINVLDGSADVLLEVRDDGGLIGTERVTLDPGENLQASVSSLLPIDGFVRNVMVLISSSQPIIAYGSRVDQLTGDPLLLTARRATQPPADTAAIDPVGSTAGARDSFWKTELNLTNLGEEPSVVQLNLLPLSSENVHRARQELDARQSVSLESLMTELFGDLPAKEIESATLLLTSDQPLDAWARVYNEGPHGTFGQRVEAFRDALDTTPPLRRSERRSLFPLEQSDVRRTNLGIAEVAGLPADLTVRVFDSGGTLLYETELRIDPLESMRANGVLIPVGLSGLIDGRVEIESSGEGEVVPWISVVENDSGDARYVN